MPLGGPKNKGGFVLQNFDIFYKKRIITRCFFRISSDQAIKTLRGFSKSKKIESQREEISPATKKQ